MNHLLKHILHLRNTIDFPLRSFISFSTPYSGKTENKSTLFTFLKSTQQKSAKARETELRTQYSLEALYNASTNRDYLQNLTTLEFLEQSSSTRSSESTIRVRDQKTEVRIDLNLFFAVRISSRYKKPYKHLMGDIVVTPLQLRKAWSTTCLEHLC